MDARHWPAQRGHAMHAIRAEHCVLWTLQHRKHANTRPPNASIHDSADYLNKTNATSPLIVLALCGRMANAIATWDNAMRHMLDA